MVALPVILGLLPSLAWLVFYLHEDFRHPEPKQLVAFTFLLGGISTFLVLPVQLVVNGWLARAGIEQFELSSFVVLGTLEELFKFGMVFLFIRKARAFTFEPIHPMVYMITAALGFAAVENIASLFRAADGTLLNSTLLETTILRFIGATLLHALASGLVGYYWGKAMALREEPGRFLAQGLAYASLLHAAFNYLIIKTGPVSFAIVFLVITAFFILNDFEILKRYERA